MQDSPLQNGRTYHLAGPNVQVKAVYLEDVKEWMVVDEWSPHRREWKVDPHGGALLTLTDATEWRPDGTLSVQDLHELA